MPVNTKLGKVVSYCEELPLIKLPDPFSCSPATLCEKSKKLYLVILILSDTTSRFRTERPKSSVTS